MRVLGYIQSSYFIPLLKKIIEDGNYGRYENEWESKYYAELIDDNKAELFEFSKKLDKNAQQFLGKIRAKARDNIIKINRIQAFKKNSNKQLEETL